MNYGGESLTKEQEQRVRDILTGILWEEIQKNKVNDKIKETNSFRN